MTAPFLTHVQPGLLTSFYDLTIDYRLPLSVSVVYVLLVCLFNRLNTRKGNTATLKGNPTRILFHRLVVLHNVSLCLFSAFVFIKLFPLIVRRFMSESFRDAYCDSNDYWRHNGLAFLAWIFYVSKIYELLDTAVLLIKGKQSSFLQTFHHTGSILCMYAMYVTSATGVWIFVLFNSFIHTWMYLYYALTCFGYSPRWKKFLTSMQITQFVVGNPLSLGYGLISGCVRERIMEHDPIARLIGNTVRSQFACMLVTFLFVTSLVFLFRDFSRRTYGKIGSTKSAVGGKADRKNT